jgi:hypothetical protein
MSMLQQYGKKEKCISAMRNYNYSVRQKKLRTSKYRNTESVPLEWFRQKQAINTSIQGSVYRQKAQEMTLKLNIYFTPSNGWSNQFRKCAGISYRTTSRNPKGYLKRM